MVRKLLYFLEDKLSTDFEGIKLWRFCKAILGSTYGIGAYEDTIDPLGWILIAEEERFWLKFLIGGVLAWDTV